MKPPFIPPPPPDRAPDTPRLGQSPLEALITAGALPAPGESPQVSHEQLYLAIAAFDQNVTAMRLSLARVETDVAHVKGMQLAESRALSDRLIDFNDLRHEVEVLKRLAGLDVDAKLERHHRDSHPGHDTTPAPPPELDADERTTPGHRVPTYDGDPGHE